MEQTKAAVPQRLRRITRRGRLMRNTRPRLRRIIGSMTRRPTAERQKARTSGSCEVDNCLARIRNTVSRSPDKTSQAAPTRLCDGRPPPLAVPGESDLSNGMARFTRAETREIDRIWRTLPPDHVWTGWAAIGNRPARIWLYRRQQNWRRFPLVKGGGGYCLYDEDARQIACADRLADVLGDVEAIPARGDS